ncbi:MAG TPA: HAMP domain-containing sensor histidine kinase [Promineifilum sp.]|nr:HAMP domain-containing sensor histidine kinase [Promineifilum sp.]HRO23152.1 HAMP domain-containing sensor histidine kinase [Promineifilum sp.]HRO89944.1 HAMP domain-containing sensor histidine kinase [Promineifilum sp.]HRQ12830.1 HAMP domain-containing sensor histidine kinase [Promineifilum sp.]
MRSLSLKLTLAFLIVGLTGVVLVSVFVGRMTRREFDRFVVDRYHDDVLAEVTEYYARNGSWDNLRGALRWRRGPGGAAVNGGMIPLISLTDSDGLVVFSTIPGDAIGRRSAIGDDGDQLPVEVDGDVVGYLRFADRSSARDVRGSPEARFLTAVDRAVRWSAAGAAVLALLLGIILAGTISRPVRELTEATKVLAGGDLGHQVPVRTSDEIGELAHSFNQMSADLAHSNQLRRQMTADIAHDLRTPLSVILGYSEALADGKLPGGPETYEAIHRQAQHLNRLIEDLRTLSLADAGQLSLVRRPVEPRGLLEHTALAYLPAAEARQIALLVEAADVPPILVDPDRILQVLGNLVSNALRHTPDGGSISLSATQHDDQVLLRVRDTGSGIPAEELPQIFDRFYRGDMARTSDGSSGLGLAIARSLIGAHGGSISAGNVAGGAQFTIALPMSAHGI